MLTIIKKMLRPILIWYARKLSIDAERVFWMVLELTLTHRVMVSMLLVINIFAAVFESSSLGLLAIAVEQVTVGSDSGGLLSKLGPIGEWLSGLSDNMAREHFFLLLVLMAVAGQVLRAAIQYAGVLVSAELSVRVLAELQSTVVHRMMRWSYPQISRYKRGELGAFIRQSTTIASLVKVLNGLLSNGLILVGYMFVMLWVSWQMTIVGLLAVILFSVGITFIFKELRRIGHRAMRAALRAGHDAMELFQAPKLLRVFSMEAHAEDRMMSALKDMLKARKQKSIWSGMIGPLGDVFTIVAAASVLVGGYFLLSSSSQSALPSLLAFILVMNRTMNKVAFINGSRSSIASSLPGAQMVSQVMQAEDKTFTREDGVKPGAFTQKLEFRNVFFTYPRTSTTVLKDICFTIRKGEMVAFVGGSGAGKSTIADLLLGLYDADKGEIFLDDVEVKDANAQAWRRHFGVVTQESFLFNDSVARNIAFARPDASSDEIRQAARVANAEGFIDELEEGFDTNIGDQGYRLSGGQIQRLSLARAVIAQPDILLLDEATSALDTLSERRIVDAIENMKGNTTMVIIAHRLSTIMNADRIIVLDQGRLVEQGDHETLLAQNGFYASLWKMQTSRTERSSAPEAAANTISESDPASI